MRHSISALAAFLLLSGTAAAVEPGGVKIDGKWSVVGVIASGGATAAEQATGVAVVRNNATKATYTLQIGDSLPTEFGFVLKTVKGRQVVLSDGKQDVTLSFAEASAPTEEDPASVSARFIDSYYKGLAETATFEGGEPAREGGDVGLALPLKRFGPYKGEEGRSRFELYRTDRPYRAGEADEREGDEDGRFVVSYDNFEDVPPEGGVGGQGMSFDDWIESSDVNGDGPITE